MDADITDAEWEALSPANFETYSLLHAVDAVDDLRNDLNDGEHAAPPQASHRPAEAASTGDGGR